MKHWSSSSSTSRLRSHERREKHAAKTIKPDSPRKSKQHLPLTTTTSSLTTTLIDATVQRLFNDTIAENPTSSATDSMESTMPNSLVLSTATATSPMTEIITRGADTTSEWSSTTSMTTLFSTTPQEPDVSADKNTTDDLPFKKRRPQLATPTKARGQHWVIRGHFRSPPKASLLEKVGAPAVSDRRTQAIAPPRIGSIQGLSLLDNGVGSNSLKLKLSRGENNFKLRKSDTLLPRMKA
ncbi:hypothetical protein OSTOST_18395, partial [Ostertagia ostertagi]